MLQALTQTLTVYGFLTVSLWTAARYSAARKTGFFLICAVAVYAVVFGLRSGVGMDYYSYQRWYDDASLGIQSYAHLEPGFRLLMNACASMHLPFSFFLGLIAFIQLYLVFRSVRPFDEAWPFLALTFMLGGIWLSYANGLRQQLSFCIFAYSLRYIAGRRWLKYYLCVAIAMLFHDSAVILLLVYPFYVFRNEWFKRRWLQLALLAAVLAFSNLSLAEYMSGRLDALAGFLGYDIYFNDSFELTQTVRRGLGYWINLAVSVCLILWSGDVKRHFGDRLVYVMYDLFYFGVLWRYLFIDSIVFSRVNYYFGGFEYIYAALTLAALWNERDMRKFLLLALYGMVFIALMYRMNTNTALFMFNWQNAVI